MAMVVFTTLGTHDWYVPPAVTSVTVRTWGSGLQTGGIKAAHDVTPGERLRIVVGGPPTVSGPGYNGGGLGAYFASPPSPYDFLFATHGWGASDLRQGGTTIDDRIQVGGGSGGRAVVHITPGDEFTPEGYYFEVRGVGGNGDPAASLVVDGATATGADGAPAPSSYPGVYLLDGTSYPAAGGGGYVGGRAGQVWLTGPGGYFGDGYVWPTTGNPGSNYSDTPLIGVVSGPFIFYLYSRPDDVSAYAPGRVDIEWDTDETPDGLRPGLRW